MSAATDRWNKAVDAANIAQKAMDAASEELRLARIELIIEVNGTAKGITNREMEVLILIREGLRDKEIAGRLNVSVSAIKKHVANMLKRFNVRSRHDL